MEPADPGPGPHDPYLLERRRFIAMIAGGLLATPLAADALLTLLAVVPAASIVAALLGRADEVIQ